MVTTVVQPGDQIQNGNRLPIFARGAYNLGPVLTKKPLLTTAVHAGEGLTHPTGAAGEDSWLIHPDKSDKVIAIAEWDQGQVAGVSTDYTITVDSIPAIMFQNNPGCTLRNIQCVDPGANVDSLAPITSSSGTAGSFMPVTEGTLITSAVDTKYGFNGGTSGTNGANGTFINARTYMRQAYYLADPNAAYLDVMYLGGPF